jgi:hypothetical protein
MTLFPNQLRPLTPSELQAMSSRQLRSLVGDARRERLAIQQQAVARGADAELGERLAAVEALERGCRQELDRRGRFRSLRRALVAARSQGF